MRIGSNKMLLSNATVNPHFREHYQEQAEFTPPSYSASISGNFLKQLLEPEVSLEKIAPLAGLHPHFSSLNDLYDAVQHVTETPGLPLTQKMGDGIAALLGFALNPINIALGSAGGLLAKGTVKGIAAIAPEFLSNLAGKTITKLSSETVGSLSEKVFTRASIGAVSLLPENLAESVKPDNKIDVSHLITASSIAGGFGLALGTIPFAASVIKAKLVTKAETAEINTLNAAKHSENIIPEEKEWYQDYQQNPEDPDLNKRAAEILKKNKPDLAIDPVENKVNIPLLTPSDIKSLRAILPEELLSRKDSAHVQVLSDFIHSNALDRLKQNSTLSAGLKEILNALENKGKNNWKLFLPALIDHLDSDTEPLARINTLKDYLKQRIENQLPDSKLTEQQASNINDRLHAYQASLEETADLSTIASKHLENSELVKEAEPSLKKYQEFKTKAKVFNDLLRCLQVKS